MNNGARWLIFFIHSSLRYTRKSIETSNSIVCTYVDYLYSIWELERSSNWFIKHPYVPEWTITMNFLEQNGKHIEAKKPQCQSLQHKVIRTRPPYG